MRLCDHCGQRETVGKDEELQSVIVHFNDDDSNRGISRVAGEIDLCKPCRHKFFKSLGNYIRSWDRIKINVDNNPSKD